MAVRYTKALVGGHPITIVDLNDGPIDLGECPTCKCCHVYAWGCDEPHCAGIMNGYDHHDDFFMHPEICYCLPDWRNPDCPATVHDLFEHMVRMRTTPVEE
jgi:hypothetical protein